MNDPIRSRRPKQSSSPENVPLEEEILHTLNLSEEELKKIRSYEKDQEHLVEELENELTPIH